MRGRGLKQYGGGTGGPEHDVAPHAGAWIETVMIKWWLGQTVVAPHAGAWIETILYADTDNTPAASPPMRGRGLKHH